MPETADFAPSFFEGPGGRIAFERIDGRGPGVVWLGGFRSDMTGAKASRLAGWARETGRAFLRFDYSGHGASDGRFEDGAVSDWADDAAAIFDARTQGPQILVGSSMGAWIALLLALARPARVRGFVLVAPAPDFTERLYESLSAEERAGLERTGRVERPSPYAPAPDVFTRRLFDDGRRHLVLPRVHGLRQPSRILHGLKDEVVASRDVVRLAETLGSDDLVATFSGDGDHRLSAPKDLDRLVAAVEELAR